VASSCAIEAITSFIKLSVQRRRSHLAYGIDPTLSFDGNRLRTAICSGQSPGVSRRGNE
jgi:hypothetical protein